ACCFHWPLLALLPWPLALFRVLSGDSLRGRLYSLRSPSPYGLGPYGQRSLSLLSSRRLEATSKALPRPQAQGRGFLVPHPDTICRSRSDRSPTPNPRKGPLRRFAPLRGLGFGLLWSCDRRRWRRGGGRGSG